MTTPPESPTPSNEDDPHPNHSRFVGRPVSFNHPIGQPDAHRLVGMVEAQRYVGRTVRGGIPDYELEIRGRSGKVIRVSLVESYATFPE